jgi:hypothetical protein
MNPFLYEESQERYQDRLREADLRRLARIARANHPSLLDWLRAQLRAGMSSLSLRWNERERAANEQI